MDESTIPRPRQVVPGVDLEEVIGRGGFATVYRGTQLSLNRPVAVKIDSRTLDDPRNRRRFLREVTASGRISAHPHVVSLIDAGTTSDQQPYLVMELCPGGTLSTLRKATGGRLPAADACDIGIAVASALGAAHAAGILHRDIKPSNVLLDEYGAPRLSDFGLAALPTPGEELSVTLEALTPAFAAPEAFEGAPPTTRSDVWALGATIHAMMTGRHPRSDPSGDSTYAQVVARSRDPLPALDVAPGLAAVIAKATAIDPAARYADGGELHAALVAARGELGPAALVTTGPDVTVVRLPAAASAKPAAGASRGIVPMVLVGALALLLGGGLGAGAVTLATRAAPAATVTAPSPSEPAGAQTSPTSSPSGDSKPGYPALPVGQCWGGIVNVAGTITAKPVQSCTEKHYWETFAVGYLATDIDSPAEWDIQLDPAVQQLCNATVLFDYTGDSKKYQIAVIPPRDAAFAAGDRRFACVAAPEKGGVQTRSLKG